MGMWQEPNYVRNRMIREQQSMHRAFEYSLYGQSTAATNKARRREAQRAKHKARKEAQDEAQGREDVGEPTREDVE